MAAQRQLCRWTPTLSWVTAQDSCTIRALCRMSRQYIQESSPGSSAGQRCSSLDHCFLLLWSLGGDLVDPVFFSLTGLVRFLFPKCPFLFPSGWEGGSFSLETIDEHQRVRYFLVFMILWWFCNKLTMGELGKELQEICCLLYRTLVSLKLLCH